MPHHLSRYASIAAMVVLLSGCYTFRITERYWLQPKPASALADSSALAVLPVGYRVTPFAIRAGDSVEVHGVRAVHDSANATVLYFGGDDFTASGLGPATLRALTAAARVNVVLVDYPGFGSSTGPQTLAVLKQMALATFDAIRRDSLGAHTPLIVHGYSLGSFVAAYVADARRVDGLVLQNTATTPKEWARTMFAFSRLVWWAKPAYPFVRIKIDATIGAEDNVARVRRYRGPLLLLAGGKDVITVPRMARTLAGESASPSTLVRLVELPDAGHNNMLSHREFAPAYGAFVTLVSTTR